MPTLPQGGVRYFRRFLFDLTATENDWSLGMVRDAPRNAISPGGSYTLTDFFVDKPAMLYKRGGTTYQATALGTNVDVIAVAAPEYRGDPRVIAIASDGASASTLYDVTTGTPATGIDVHAAQPIENLAFYSGGNTVNQDRLILTSNQPSAGPYYGPQKVSLVGSPGVVTVASLGGSPPPAKYACVHAGRLVLGNTYANPGRIYFSPDVDIEGVPVAIASADATAKTFTLNGDYNEILFVGNTFTVTGSTSNNGTYTILSVVVSGTTPVTTITVASVPSSTGTMGTLTTNWDVNNSWIETGLGIMGLASIQGVLIIFARGRCQRVLHSIPPGHVDSTGAPDTDMEIQPMGDVGCIDGRTICYANNLCYFANEHGIYSTNGVGFESLTQKPDNSGISQLWQDTMRGFSPALGAVVSMGVYNNQFLLVSVIHNSGAKSQFMCYLPSTSWVQLSSTTNATMYAPSFAPTHEMFIGASTDTRVRKLSTMWQPGSSYKNDAEGTAVTPLWESRMISNAVAMKRYGFAHLTYDMRDAASDNPTLLTQIATGLEADSGYAAVVQSPLSETTRATRKRFRVYKDTQGLHYRLTQQNASSKTELYYLETEIGPYYVADWTVSNPPVITSIRDLSDRSKMELVSFLQPFFPQNKKVHGGGAGKVLRELLVVVDGMGSTISTGISGDVRLDFACTILGWTLLADQSGSIQIDIWKDTYLNYPPTVLDTITAAAKPLISSASKATSTALTGWTTAIAAGDTLRFNVDSVSTIKRVTLALELKG